MGKFLFSLGAAVFVLFAVPAYPQAKGDAWVRATSLDGYVSAETPCSLQQIASLNRSPPTAVGAFQLAPNARVVCADRNFIAFVGWIEDTAQSESSAFDQMLRSGPMVDSSGSAIQVISLNGRRAVFNRNVQQGIVAQTSIIEVSHTRLIVAVAGGLPNSELSITAQNALVDHFVNSIQVDQ